MSRFASAVVVFFVLLMPCTLLSAPPLHQWSESFGGTGTESPQDVKLDAAGNIYVTGYFNGTTNLGGANLVSLGSDDGFVAKYNAAGMHQWSLRFGTASTGEGGAGVAIDPAGNVIVAGAAANRIALRKYDSAGTPLLAQNYGPTDGNEAADVATDAAGNIFVTGYYRSSMDFGCGPLPGASAPSSNMFLVKFDPNGVCQWSKGFKCTGFNLDVDGSGAVTVTGGFTSPVDFGSGPLVSAGSSDGYIARFNSAGTHQWSVRFGGAGADGGYDVECDAAGNCALAALSGGAMVARYDAAGTQIWSHNFGASLVYDLALDNSGGVVLTGPFSGTVNFGEGPVTSAGNDDVYLTKYDITGTHQWAIRAGNTNTDTGWAVAADNLGGIVATGYFQNSIDFGGGPLGNAGGYDVYLASLLDQTPVPVRISSFGARLSGHAVTLSWDLWSDDDIEAYTIYRSTAGAPEVAIATGPATATHGFVDYNTEAGQTYRYELMLQTTSGNQVRSQPVSVTIPRFTTSLAQNAPNPVRGSTNIQYTLGSRARAVVGVYDAAGRLVMRIDDGDREAGTYRTLWNARDVNGALVGSGVYFYRLEGVANAAPRKMIVIR